jgi:hypothetical protein
MVVRNLSFPQTNPCSRLQLCDRGLYSLETELSFGMGRPDTLGADVYHNRHFPITIYSRDAVGASGSSPDLHEPPQCAILEFMVSFSRIIRIIRLQLYVPDSPATRDPTVALQHAATIEQELDGWLANLPDTLRPQRVFSQETSLKSAREPQFARKQKLVLGISMWSRSPFVRRPSLMHRQRVPQPTDPPVRIVPRDGRKPGRQATSCRAVRAKVSRLRQADHRHHLRDVQTQ